MKRIILIGKKALSCLLIVSFCNLLWFSSFARAEMIGTEAVAGEETTNLTDRGKAHAFFNREEVQLKLGTYGVSREEVLARVDSLTDEEVAALVYKIDQMTAGGYDGGDDFFIGLLVIFGIAVIILIGIVVVGIIAIFKTPKSKKAQVEDINKSKYEKGFKPDPAAGESQIISE